MSTRTRPIVIGVFPRPVLADGAIDALLRSGFPTDRISVVCPESCQREVEAGVDRVEPAGSNTLEAGALGAALGGLTAAVGVAASGGVGLLVAGPLLGAGAVTGGFLGAMATRGLEPEIADFYDQALVDGNVLVAVDTEPADGVPSAELAEDVLARCGARPMNLREG